MPGPWSATVADAVPAVREGFLREIVGVLVIGRHVVDGGVNALLITPYELVIRPHIALLRPAHHVSFGFLLRR